MISRNTWLVALIAVVSAVFFLACNQCVDTDGDGYGSPAHAWCTFVTEDCDDDIRDDPEGCDECSCWNTGCTLCARCINPGMREGPDNDQPGYQTCEDGVDNDCDGLTDLLDDGCFVACSDLDGDGYGSPWSDECDYSLEDCDDDPSDDPAGCDTCTCGDAGCSGCAHCIKPGMQEGPVGDETCEDGVDNDCDDLVDIADNACQACTSSVDCDDGNPCTDDSCEGFLCVYTDNSVSCNDENPCTLNDACSEGVCEGDPLDADGDTYVPDSCGGEDCDDDPSDDPEGCDACTCGDTECSECAKCINPGGAEGPRDEPTCRDCVDNDCDGSLDGGDSACAGQSPYDGTFEVTYQIIWHTCFIMPVLDDSAEITVQDDTIMFFVAEPCITASGAWNQANSQGSGMTSPWSCMTPGPAPGCEPCQRMTVNITFADTDSFQGTCLFDVILDADCGPSMCMAEYTITGIRPSP
jgi:hypothetical protein